MGPETTSIGSPPPRYFPTAPLPPPPPHHHPLSGAPQRNTAKIPPAPSPGTAVSRPHIPKPNPLNPPTLTTRPPPHHALLRSYWRASTIIYWWRRGWTPTSPPRPARPEIMGGSHSDPPPRKPTPREGGP